MRVLLILLLLLLAFTLSFKPAKGASASFKASIIGWQPEAQSKTQVLGEFASCKVVKALKFDNFNSACFLKKENKVWQLESFASQCEVECLKVSNMGEIVNTAYFNQIYP